MYNLTGTHWYPTLIFWSISGRSSGKRNNGDLSVLPFLLIVIFFTFMTFSLNPDFITPLEKLNVLCSTAFTSNSPNLHSFSRFCACPLVDVSISNTSLVFLTDWIEPILDRPSV